MKIIGSILLYGFLGSLSLILLFKAFPDFLLFDNKSITIGIVVGVVFLLLDAVKYGLQKLKSRLDHQ